MHLAGWWMFLLQLYLQQCSFINHSDTPSLLSLIKQQISDRSSTPRPQRVNAHTQAYIHTIYSTSRPNNLLLSWESDSISSNLFKSSSLLLWATMLNDNLPHQQWLQFPEGKGVPALSAHYRLYSDIGLHGDTLYPSINLLPPLALRSLKVTSAFLPLQTFPVPFIAALYIWTALLSLTATGAPHKTSSKRADKKEDNGNKEKWFERSRSGLKQLFNKQDIKVHCKNTSLYKLALRSYLKILLIWHTVAIRHGLWQQRPGHPLYTQIDCCKSLPEDLRQRSCS